MSSISTGGGSGGGGGVANVKFVEGNTGGPVGPDLAGTIFVVGAGNINVAGNAGTNTQTVTLVGTTNHAVQVGNAAGSLTSIPVGLTGQVLTGVTGADPVFAAPVAGITTINGDASFVAGATVTFTGQNSVGPYGQSVQFIGNGTTTMNFNLIDGGANFFAGASATGSHITGNGTSNFLFGFNSSDAIGLTGPSVGNFVYGSEAFRAINVGNNNIIMGTQAMQFVSTTICNDNIVMGTSSVDNSSLADFTDNIYLGRNSGLTSSGTLRNNIAIGQSALAGLSDGGTSANFNIAIGYFAASAYNGSGGENNNIIIGSPGIGSQSNAIMIGSDGTNTPAATYCAIQGIAGVTVTGAAVLVDAATGQLGVAVSSERYKKDIVDMEDTARVLDLRPVNFKYKEFITEYKQYGLIAEEVATVFPELVVLDREGNPGSVKYHDLPVMLLAELKKALARIEVLEKKVGV